MDVRYRDKGRKVKCRECSKFVKEAIHLTFKSYYPSLEDSYFPNDNPLFLCKKCLKTLRSKISVLSLLVNDGVDTK